MITSSSGRSLWRVYRGFRRVASCEGKPFDGFISFGDPFTYFGRPMLFYSSTFFLYVRKAAPVYIASKDIIIVGVLQLFRVNDEYFLESNPATQYPATSLSID